MRRERKVKKILFFRIGQLGDTIVSIPSIQFFREQFPGASFVLMSDRIVGQKYVLAKEIFENTSLFSDYVFYRKSRDGDFHWRDKLAMLAVVPRLLAKRFDAVVYLAPSLRTRQQVARDRSFFRLMGISRLWGFQRNPRSESPNVHEAEWLLAQFKNDGFAVPQSANGKMDLMISRAEQVFAESWINEHLPNRNGRLVVGFAPGSKMPAKRWRIDNFWQVGHQLIKKYDIWPLVFGDASDRKAGETLVKSWKRGCNAAGELSIRQSSALLQKCDLYIGNDTGTMHLAAAVNTPCVAIFSARDLPGKWEPLGRGHAVLRHEVKCQGCMATACDDKICLMLIRPEDVAAEAEKIIQRVLTKKKSHAD